MTAPDARITDARGRKVAPLDPVVVQLRRQHDVIDGAALGRIVADIGPGIDRWPRRALVFGVLGILLAFTVLGVRLVSVAVGTGALPLDELWRRLPVFVAVIAGLWLQWFAARRVRLGRVREVMLRHGRCPHCGYDLHGSPPAPEDGAVVCPECGCAWRPAGA